MSARRLHYAVDEIEAGVARLVDDGGRDFTVPLIWLPLGARVGDVLEVTSFAGAAGGLVASRRDPDEQRRRLERSREVLERLSGTDPGGDLTL